MFSVIFFVRFGLFKIPEAEISFINAWQIFDRFIHYRMCFLHT